MKINKKFICKCGHQVMEHQATAVGLMYSGHCSHMKCKCDKFRSSSKEKAK